MSRVCTKCFHIENPTANTIFHKRYKALAKKYKITQLPSNNAGNFKQLHHIIHQIKSCLRTTYSWIHTNKYLDESSFRINPSIFKDTIFHKLIQCMLKSESIVDKNIIACN